MGRGERRRLCRRSEGGDAPPEKMSGPRSAEVMRRARALMPGGVSSPVRAFAAVGGEPPVFTAGHGCRLIDADGREYIDHVLAYGPLILGHGHPAVRSALAARLPL